MAVTDKARNEKILKRITKLHKFCGAFFFCKTFCVYKLYNFSKTHRKNYSSLAWSYRRRNLQKKPSVYIGGWICYNRHKS